MATYQDYYEIEIKAANRIIKILPTSFSFMMRDSIYRIFPSITFELQDMSGLLQEFMATIEGQRVQISYGNQDRVLVCPYVITKDSLLQIENPGIFSGRVDIEGLHAWYDDQEVLSIAYEDRISVIVRDLASEFPFSVSPSIDEIHINDTGNESIWYRPFLDQADFIKNILLPNAYSNNANRSPFYCFITNGNVFNFRNMRDMFDSTPVQNLVYRIEQGENFALTAVNDIKRWRVGSDITHPMRRRIVSYHDYTGTGSVTYEDEVLTDYRPPDNSRQKVPILDTNTFRTSYHDFGYEQREVGKQQNKQGQLHNSMRDTMILERLLITLPFNPFMSAGSTVNIDIYRIGEDGEKVLSKYFSGRYLIEECNQIWNGNQQKGFTKAILGRRYVDLPSSYIVSENLIS